MYHQVVFELTLVAVINKIDATIEIAVADLGRGRYAGLPARGIATRQIVDLGGLWIVGDDLCVALRIQPIQTYHGSLGAMSVQGKDRLVTREEDGVSATTRQIKSL